MPSPQQAFSARLYTDHLEEVEFLLAQVRLLFSDPEVPWPEIAEFEERLSTHINGLVLGGEQADAAAAELLTSDDEDIIAGAAYALALSNSKIALDAIGPAMVAADDHLLSGFFEGLKQPSNSRLAATILPLLGHERETVRALALDILGYRREGEVASIVNLLNDEQPEVVLSAARALRRRHDSAAINELQTALNRAGVVAGPEIALALMTLGNESGSRWLIDFCSSKREEYGLAPLYVGLAGAVCRESCETVAGARGLGLCGSTGEMGAAPILLNLLDREDDALAQAAAHSLMLIYGSGPTEERVAKEEWTDIDGEVVDIDETVSTQPSTSAEAWRGWLDKNTGDLPPGRVRNGKPLTAATLLDGIVDPDALYDGRQFAYYGLLMSEAPFQHFEADWPLQRQLAAIDSWRGKRL